MKSHKHAEVIKAWADGAVIEYRNSAMRDWEVVPKCNPEWFESVQYRIKPEPDQITYLLLNYPHKHAWFESNQPAEHDCIKIVRDRETGKLKSAKVIS